MVTKVKEENKKRDIVKFSKIVIGTLCSLVMVLTLLLYFSATWYIRNYGDTGFDSVLFTLLSKMDGVHGGLVSSFIIWSVLPTLICGGLLVYLIYFIKIKKILFIKIMFWQRVGVSLALALVFFVVGGRKINVFGYINRMMNTTTIYEDYFVEPSDELITFPEEKRNLIYIFLESMETTYMSEKEGGALSQNLMPELTRLAKNNINFSHNDGIGGFLAPSGTGWTVAGMVSQTSGVPLKGSAGTLENNEYGKEEFMPGVISLSDILNENGYKQALMVGSRASYANRRVYFEEHKTDYIYDLDTAKKDGVVDDDYFVWWGMEDEYMFDYAKDKLTELSKEDGPFAFTMLTVDTHFPDGYVCRLCKNKHEEQYDNVISCASRQVDSFIRWLKRQSFYDNTTIVICGDHLSMDHQYFERNVEEGYDRRVYNCFINSSVTGENYKNRTFTSVDIFPTTLAALGCEIKGERLGLGTNLFSGIPTLAEEMTYDQFEHQLMFSSDYYIKKFMVGQ